MAEAFDEAAFRTAVDMWERDPKRATTHRILTGARRVLDLLDETRRDRNGFVEEIRDLNDQLEQRKRGGEELGKSFVLLAELIKDTFRRSANDPIAALHMLGDHLAHLFENEGGLSVDDHNRVCKALEDRRRELDEVENLRAEVKRLETAAIVRAAPAGTEAAQ